MRKWLSIGLVLVAVVLIAAAVRFFTVAPERIDQAQNRVQRVALDITPGATALQATLDVADMHADSLLWKRDLIARSDRGHIDLPRLIEGHYALQVFSSVTKSPKGQNYDANGADTDTITNLAIIDLQPPRTWFSLLQRSLWHAEKLHSFAELSAGRLRLIATPADLDRLLADRKSGATVVGGMLSIEGLQDIEGNIANLDVLYAAGFRMAGLAHFFDNDVAGSMHGVAKGGLTPLGRQVVQRMEAMGMIVDLAHASHAAVAEVLAMATRPVVSSHGGVQATCKVNRNLTDDEVRGVERTGGVVGIGFWQGAVCSLDPKDVARAIAYVRDLVGIDHVGLGSDFDGSTTTGFDASEIVAVTQALMSRGFSEDDIRKVMGGNVLRVLRAGIARRG
ncbi:MULTISPECIES: dipeptidase [Bradyrhizobium]|jgi:membrane dipeptidase|uniref:dipeptidase n=1 Tax=Bradyrhizobium TaxID=374 RepID=UPI000480E75E|nr:MULTISPECIES: dipeptidase [Bradyrhizobium]MCS3450957.1 microsomal dipeptidase-like Zn-dependent dipeptidase [Bradyrhizobium elkanii]MCS3557898.1 microsomal dipeptidase-like Zn-dependent dipeptidase [Bradyrhizobium elkanii]MCW2152255.1 microsomal dipeptidase-like Zn-dependent dipeptidase [Bradyrhizobium elkanii]MCW2357869.1 microsomal dipeptidase-like Zn-dependent dipeptidase [Bradyrhizobium elkanii]MCW2375986.1 microsomal dipeptidase-like Zn-dependent dipeptidase [Bradyrhizobium elkanii]